MSCITCNDEGFWCDICSWPESECDCHENPETGGPNIIECEDCANGD